VDVVLGDLDLPLAQVQGGADVAGAHRGEVIAQRLPGHRLQLLGGHPGGHIDHRVAGVEGEGHESGGQAPVDALGGLDVVAVGAVAAVPALLDAAEGRVVDHRTGLSAQPVHLADRLLGQHRHGALALLPEGTGLSRGRRPSRSPVPTEVVASPISRGRSTSKTSRSAAALAADRGPSSCCRSPAAVTVPSKALSCAASGAVTRRVLPSAERITSASYWSVRRVMLSPSGSRLGHRLGRWGSGWLPGGAKW